MYVPQAETILQKDASRLHGLGFVLLQKPAKTEHWKFIRCGSRLFKDTETRYAMIELEALIIFWAVKNYEVFLAGMTHSFHGGYRP